jgi:hypothetical protein
MSIMAMMMLPTIAPIYRDKAIKASISRVQGALMKARSLAAINNENYYIAFTYFNDKPNIVNIYMTDPDAGANAWGAYNWDAAGRKAIMAEKPYQLDERIKFEFNIDKSMAGEECYLIVKPTGEMEVKGLNQTDAESCLPEYQPGLVKIVIGESGIADSDSSKAIMLMLVTGSFYSTDTDDL